VRLRTDRSSRTTVLAAALLGAGGLARAQDISFPDVLKLSARPADARIAYGGGPQQFGELWVPAGRGPHPVAIVVHGGCWRSAYGEDHIRPACAALARAGFAAWCLEYRRVGDEGGGWPGTFEDVARGADHLREVAKTRPLDLTRVAAVGHSAGGHLALWLAARSRLDEAQPLRGKDPLPLRGVLGLAAIPDLARAAADRVCGDSVPQLLGAAPDAEPRRYAAASPAALLPLGVPQRLVHGRRDRIVPFEMSERYAAAARRAGDAASVMAVDDAGHFDLIAPTSNAWPGVVASLRGLLR
jgi:acetyl esterase/lipase